MLNLKALLIGSEDPKQLSAFYGEVLQTKPGWDDGTYSGFEAGNGYLMIGPHDKIHGKNKNPEQIIFNFEAENVQAEFDRIKGIEGVTVIREPYNPSGDDSSKMLLATLADPDGNYFQLASPM